MQRGHSTHFFEKILEQENVFLSLNGEATAQYPVARIEPSPCMLACPAGVNVKAYVSLIAAGRFQEALQVVRERNPFPGICGRVCTHPCESFCNRTKVDEPVAICALKRFVADYELQHSQDSTKATPHLHKEKVAIIGSGPAGLTAANDLARKGYRVTVFEALSKPGGMLVAGIPSFRLPRDIIEYEIDAIRQAGVEIKTNTKISGENALNRLFRDGYRAIFIAVGAHKSLKLGIAGEEDCQGVLDGLTFLRDVNLERRGNVGKSVAIIGGGNTAIDAARTALRVGAEDVTIVYRRTKNEMPANESEVDDAAEEGVRFHFLAAPVKVLKRNDRVTGIKCTKMKLGKPDASGRRRPIPVQGSEFTIPADTVIAAISQEPDLPFLPAGSQLRISKWHTLEVTEPDLATPVPGVFAGGDAVTGPTTIIDAIAGGHRAAESIEHYLQGQPLETKEMIETPLEVEIKTDLKQVKKRQRAQMQKHANPNSIRNFDEIETGLSEAQALAEAQRCLRCGPCRECFTCLPQCNKLVTIVSLPDSVEERLLRLPREFKPHLASDASLHIEEEEPTALNLFPTTCYVKEEICRGCGDCVTACEYQAPALLPKGNGLYVARIDTAICRGCGTCVSVCPSGAIEQNYFSDHWLKAKLRIMDPAKKNVVVVTCSWNSAQLGNGLSGNSVPDDLNLILIHTACSGRVEPAFIINAFEQGAQSVLVVGCPMNRCHYSFGNKIADTHFARVQNLLNLLGYPSDRFQWAWPENEHLTQFREAVDAFLQNIQEPECSENLLA